jgi:enediyne biosynthesis protein E4
VRDVVLTDITDLSPDLTDHPYGGAHPWNHSDKYAPGVALADLDGDGVLDLIQPRNDRSDPELRPLVIYRGLGDGRFEKAAMPPWDPAWNATAVVAFDYDGDGAIDLFIGIDGADSRLFRNAGNFEFQDVTENAGLVGIADRVYAAAAGDVTGNGFPDLYLAQFAADLPDHGAGLADNLLLENLGDGTFAPPRDDLRCEGSATLGVALVDLDGDGDIDIYVANDFFPDCLYENVGDGQFREISAEAGTRDGAYNGMGVGVGDLLGRGRLDLLITDTQEPDASPGHAVYLQREEPLRFESAAAALGLDGLSVLPVGEDWTVGWGAGIVDLSGDGRNEVHIATHIQREELLFVREGDRFVPDLDAMAVLGSFDARGSAYGDLTGDGAIDLVIARRGAPLQVVRNDSGGRYLVVEIEPAYRALGSVVVATIDGERHVRPIQSGSSYMSSSPPVAHFGLCNAERVERVEVRTPDGGHAVAENVAPGILRLELR